MNLKNFVNNVPNWPKRNIAFKDISPLLRDHDAFTHAIEKMHPLVEKVDYWIGIESRGFMFAGALAQLFGGGMIMMRKSGKLPPPVISEEYALEYGSDKLEIHKGSGNVVIVDDVIATGGTLRAANSLCEQAGYTVLGCAILIDLVHVHQQDPFTINDKPVHSVLQYK
jgi:adenine phosphoribosyltransferase